MARRSLAILFALLPSTHGHGYLKTPRSRNLYAYQERDWEDGGGKSPYPEDCKYFMRCACIIGMQCGDHQNVHLMRVVILSNGYVCIASK